VKVSGALTLSSGVVAKPADAWFILDVYTEAGTYRFDELNARKRGQVIVADGGLDNASATHPKFFDEAGNINTLGITSGNIKARYVRLQPDLTVSVVAAGNGTIYATAANLTWAAATKLLTVTGANTLFSISPVNKIIMFRTSSVVYIGRIASYDQSASDCVLTLTSDGLPAGNINPSSIIELVVSDLWPDDADLVLDVMWHGDVIEKMTAMGEQDAVRISTIQ